VKLRRKQLSPELEASFAAFRRVLDLIEPAKAALTEVMPTTRLPGRPLPDALLEFEEGVARARGLMPAWRAEAVEPAWTACDQGIDEALRRARRLREEAPELGGFEGLIWAVEELLGPLEVFASAAARFRELGAR
jgi:exonuclease VII small subunit